MSEYIGMLDLEFLDADRNREANHIPVVLSIAIVIQRESDRKIVHANIINLNLIEQLDNGFHVGRGCLAWWCRQKNFSEEILPSVLNTNSVREDLVEFIRGIFLSLGVSGEEITGNFLGLYGNGPITDNLKLMKLLEHYNINNPFGYDVHRCFKTVRNNFIERSDNQLVFSSMEISTQVRNLGIELKMKRHNPLYDCINQLAYYNAIIDKIYP